MTDLYFNVLKVFFVLLMMVCGMILLYRFAGKQRLFLKQKDAHYGLRRVDTVYLGYKKFVSLVEVKDHLFVLGVAEKDIVLLAKWKKEEINT